jgi:hypothetical protein
MSNAAAISRIEAVHRVYADLYDATDEDGHRRNLEAHEALFLSAVDCIGRTSNKEMKDAFKVWGNGKAYDAVCSLTYRSKAEKLEKALASYKAICAALEAISDDIEEIFAEAAE